MIKYGGTLTQTYCQVIDRLQSRSKREVAGYFSRLLKCQSSDAIRILVLVVEKEYPQYLSLLKPT